MLRRRGEMRLMFHREKNSCIVLLPGLKWFPNIHTEKVASIKPAIDTAPMISKGKTLPMPLSVTV